MTTSLHKHPIRATTAAAVAALCALALSPVAAQAAGKTETLRFFSKDVSLTITTADGKVIEKPPYPEAQPGDILDINSLDYVGSKRRHARRWSASHHVHCVFADGPPDCVTHVAIRGSLLIFRGDPGTLINGTGRYQGATGRVLSDKPVSGGSNVVARIHLRRGARSATAPAPASAAEPAWRRALRIRGEAMNRQFAAQEEA